MKRIKAVALASVFTVSLAASAFAEAEVKVGGEIRVRDVISNNYDFDKDLRDRENITTTRTRINVDAKIDETTKAFIQLQDTRVWGITQDTTDTSNHAGFIAGGDFVGVSQAYMQFDKLFGQPLALKLGRQALAYGDHRLVGDFEWSNYARRFDALKLVYNTDAFSVDFWTSKVSETEFLTITNPDKNGTEPGNGDGEEDGNFNGIYATVKTIPSNTLDLYLLQKLEVAAENENILTFGARLKGGAANIDWTAEAALQRGDAADDVDQEASMIAVRGGFTVPEVAGGLRIGAEFVRASGDDKADDKVETFNNLYPTNHPLYGVSDVPATNSLGGQSGSGLTAWSLNLGAQPAAGLKLLAEYWNYTATEDGNLADDKIGSEFNIQTWYAVSENVNLHAYWARFMPDDAVTGGGSDDETDNVTLQVAVKF